MIILKVKNNINILQKIFLSVFAIFSLVSCTDEADLHLKQPDSDPGIPTEVKGNVRDYLRGNNISGFKVEIAKIWRVKGSGLLGYEIIGRAVTDSEGNYSIKFNHAVRSYQKDVTYEFSNYFVGNYNYDFNTNYYYRIPYAANNSIKIGETGTVNIAATKLIELEITTNVLNNNHGPLSIYYNAPGVIMYAPNKVSLQNTTEISRLRARPDQDVDITYSYFTTINNERIRHDKKFPYHPTIDDVNRLNYTVDCSTF